VCHARGNHAKPSVVVDMPRAKPHARELPHQIRLLRCERSAAEHSHGVLAVAILDLAKTPRSERERFVPCSLREPVVGSKKRIEQSIRVIRLQIALHALRAKLSLIKRKLLPRFKPNNVVVANLELNAALLPAEAAMRLDDAIRSDLRLLTPASLRCVIQVRPVLLLNLFGAR